jgi:thiamine biosynthesis lipoprotein
MQGLEVLNATGNQTSIRSVARCRRWEAARFRAMGTDCSVVVIDGPLGLAAFAEAEVARCEQRWSRFREDSELCRLNARAGGGFVPVSHDTFAVVERAVALWHSTDGWFDPTVLDSLLAAGYDSSYEHIRARNAFVRVEAPSRTPGCAGIGLDADASAVRLPPGVHLDLGGVGKGFAADLVAERIIERGARGVCVELGGDIRVLGEAPDDDGWTIEVEDPFEDGRTLFSSRLDDDAIVTSSRLFRRWSTTDGEAHHLIDPTTGASAWTGVAAVVTRACDATRAEGLAKAVLVAGPQLAAALAMRSGTACWLVMDDRRVLAVGERDWFSC